MPLHRNHVEARSRKYAARQYVSETHDHKPDAPVKEPAETESTDPTHAEG